MIASLRAELARLARDAVTITWAVHQWLPEDVAELPCIVIGRPTLTQAPDVATGILGTTEVTVVGRRLTADDAQEELDQVTWTVLGAYNGLRGMKSPTVPRLIVTSVDPELVAIAGDEFPTYRLTTEATLIDC